MPANQADRLDVINSFWTEARALSAALASATEALRETGTAPGEELLASARAYSERLRNAAGADAQSSLTLDDLSRILRKREKDTLIPKLAALERLTASVQGYENVLRELRAAAATASISERVDERGQTLAWLHDAIIGETKIGPADFSAVRERLTIAGFDQLVAVALVARHLQLRAPPRRTATRREAAAVMKERVDYVVDSFLPRGKRATARTELLAALDELFEGADPPYNDQPIKANHLGGSSHIDSMCAEELLLHSSWPYPLGLAVTLLVEPSVQFDDSVTDERYELRIRDQAVLAQQLVWLLVEDFPWIESLGPEEWDRAADPRP
jgi:hypothetical protein